MRFLNSQKVRIQTKRYLIGISTIWYNETYAAQHTYHCKLNLYINLIYIWLIHLPFVHIIVLCTPTPVHVRISVHFLEMFSSETEYPSHQAEVWQPGAIANTTADKPRS